MFLFLIDVSNAAESRKIDVFMCVIAWSFDYVFVHGDCDRQSWVFPMCRFSQQAVSMMIEVCLFSELQFWSVL